VLAGAAGVSAGAEAVVEDTGVEGADVTTGGAADGATGMLARVCIFKSNVTGVADAAASF
jgi:hypothetical protein